MRASRTAPQAAEDVPQGDPAQPGLQGEQSRLDLTAGGRQERLEPRLVAGLLELGGCGGIGPAEGLLVVRGGPATEVERDDEDEDDGDSDDDDQGKFDTAVDEELEM